MRTINISGLSPSAGCMCETCDDSHPPSGHTSSLEPLLPCYSPLPAQLKAAHSNPRHVRLAAHKAMMAISSWTSHYFLQISQTLSGKNVEVIPPILKVRQFQVFGSCIARPRAAAVGFILDYPSSIFACNSFISASSFIFSNSNLSLRSASSFFSLA
ncbi:hypothetical protein PoB_007337100 [Plakobranchus ocellatus]|uniref:Uncharacterized protein n=1 Tax=Plakobranchus ocellatus TaxID=259542 RepID=A0AAV4DRY9_9GAST|nr:hypothetical protein PoB_007337100 [Plakobranchus ocellatus]